MCLVIIRWVLFICLFIGSSDIGGQELLQNKDVSTIMQQIFDQHGDKSGMTSNILKHSFKVYIDQFDPDRVYLLDSEAAPYLQMSDSRVNEVIQEYKANNFQIFEQLNKTIQKAILRARSIRANVEKNSSLLFQSAKHNENDPFNEWSDPDLKLQFAKNESELQSRVQSYIRTFLQAEEKHFGKEIVLKNQSHTLSILNTNMEEKENHYLFTDEHGHPLSLAEHQNLFVMHILKAIASSLDAHTTFFTPSEAYDMRVRLEKELVGIGVELQQAPDGSILINGVVANGPAGKSGKVLAKDTITEINGQDVTSEPFEKVMEMIHGDAGSPITLTLKRQVAATSGKGIVDQLSKVTLKREEIIVNDERVQTSFEKFQNGIIGTVKLDSFYQGDNGVNSENDLKAAFDKLQKEGKLLGVILDLRENSGGFLGQAVKVVGLFITNGVVVISKYFNGEERFYRDLNGQPYYTGPLIILTSRATASAAEIVAQALQDYGVALVVGDDHTYGKGTIQSQTVTESNASSFFKVTVGKYYTVSGKTPQINGVTADIIVPGIFNFEHIGEKYLDTAIQPDTVPSDYNDNLSDVSPNLKAWFLKYYMPTLQAKKQLWSNMLPALKANSANRIGDNAEYQAFLKDLKAGKGRLDKDYQLTESQNIMKDMIIFQLQVRDNPKRPLTAGIQP